MAARLLDKIKRVFPYALLIVYFAQFTAFIIGIGGFEPFVRSTDFMPTIAAAQMITEGHGSSLYDLDAQHETQQRILSPYKSLAAEELLPFNHLPFEALFIVPFMTLSYVRVTLFWTLLSVVALGATLYILQRTLPIKRPWLFVVIICSLSYQPVFRAFLLGQNSPLVLLGICITYASIRRDEARWDIWAGIGMVLVALKLQVLPLVLLLVLMKGPWKAVLWFSAQMAVLAVLCMPLLGVMWPLHYLKLLQSVSQWGSKAAINPAIMHNWRGFATNTVGTVSSSGANILMIILTILSLLLFLYAWWKTRKCAHDAIPSLIESHDGSRVFAVDMVWALGVVTAILISPHLNPHDLILLLFSGWIMVYIVQNDALPQKLSIIWIRLLQIIYLIMPVAFFVRGYPSLWVILNVSALALSTWLFLISINATHKWEASQLVE